MTDQLSPIFQLPYPDPDDPLGGVAGTLEDFVSVFEDEFRFSRRRLGFTAQNTNSSTTTTTEIVCVSHSFSTRVGDNVEYHWDGFVHSTVVGDWIQLDLHDGNLAGPVVQSVSVEARSTLESRATPVSMFWMLNDAATSGFRTLTLGIRRVSGTGNVKRVGSASKISYARSYRTLRAPL